MDWINIVVCTGMGISEIPDQPNAAHHALDRLQKEWRHGNVTIFTKCVDDFHQLTGTEVYVFDEQTDMIRHRLDLCNIYATIGSSCDDFTKTLPNLALMNNANTYLINREIVEDNACFRNIVYGLVSELVPKWVNKITRQYSLRHFG